MTQNSNLRTENFVLLFLLPQFVFVCGLVSNDALLVTLCAAMTWLLVRGPRNWGWRYWALVGVVLGIGLLTKQSALLLVPVIGVAAMLWEGWRRAVGVLAVVASVTVLVSGWWFWRNVQLYGDLFGLAAFQQEFATQAFVADDMRAWLTGFWQLYQSFHGVFGWMNLPSPWYVLPFFIIIELLALAGWLRLLVRGQGRDPRWLLLLALTGMGLAWVVAFAFTAGLVAWQGRLLFPALPALALLFGRGLTGLFEIRPLSLMLHMVSFFLAVSLPLTTIVPAYPRVVLSEQEARQQLITMQPVMARFGLLGDPGADIRAVQLGQLRAGQPLDVTLLWQAQGRQNRDWSVFVHLVDAQEQILAEVNGPPHPTFPMTQWVAGDWIVSRFQVVIPAALPDAVYSVRIGLWDEYGTAERAARYSAEGVLEGDALEVTLEQQ